MPRACILVLLACACGRVHFNALEPVDAIAVDSVDASEPLCAGLVGHFKLDETTGPSVLDSVSQVNASVQGSVSFDVAGGVLAGAAAFTTDGYVEVMHTQDFPVADFTWAAWVRPTDLANRTLVHLSNAVGDRSFYFKWASSVDIELLINEVAVFNDVAGFSADATWQHVAVTRAGDALTLYRNGVVLRTATNGSAIELVPGCVFRIGSGTNCDGSGSATGVWEGQLDDLRVYRRELSGEDVDVLYRASLSNSVPPC